MGMCDLCYFPNRKLLYKNYRLPLGRKGETGGGGRGRKNNSRREKEGIHSLSLSLSLSLSSLSLVGSCYVAPACLKLKIFLT
jgi:hypothetical protein